MTSHLRAYCNSGLKHFAVCLIAQSSIVDGRFPPAVRLEMVKKLNIPNILALLRLELLTIASDATLVEAARGMSHCAFYTL
jgi:hypothetical protein